MQEQKKLPQYITNLLWDVDIASLNTSLKSHAEFLANRIAEKGNSLCLRWYVKQFGATTFLQYLDRNSRLDSYTAEFWQVTK